MLSSNNDIMPTWGTKLHLALSNGRDFHDHQVRLAHGTFQRVYGIQALQRIIEIERLLAG
jgi:hypothetical protein